MDKTSKQLELKLCPIGEELLMEENPVEKSRSGCNTVFHHCDALERRASYAGCLYTMDAVADGRGELVPDCQFAIESRTCPARAMRMEELRAKRTLYFVDYIELTKRRGVEYGKERETSSIQFRRKRTPQPWVGTTVAPVAEIEKKAKSTNIMDHEIDTNIMEKVLKKKVANDSQ